MATKKRVIRRMSDEAPRYVPRGSNRMEKPIQTAKLFRNGRSQAVRLPKEFRFEGEEVYVRREGKSVVLSPKASRKAADKAGRAEEWKDFFDALDSFDPTFRFVRDQPRQQQKRPSIERLGLLRRAKRKPRS